MFSITIESLHTFWWIFGIISIGGGIGIFCWYKTKLSRSIKICNPENIFQQCNPWIRSLRICIIPPWIGAIAGGVILIFYLKESLIPCIVLAVISGAAGCGLLPLLYSLASKSILGRELFPKRVKYVAAKEKE